MCLNGFLLLSSYYLCSTSFPVFIPKAQHKHGCRTPLSLPIDHSGTMQPGLPLLSTCTKFFMLFHHASFPSSPALNAGGDRKRGRKGRLVEEWRNIISMRSRRGFVLCRLPSAPSTFPPLSLPSGPGRLSCQSMHLQ